MQETPRMRDAPTGRQDASRLLPILGYMTAALFFGYAWVLRVAPSVMVEELMRDFSVGAAVLGNLSAAYFYGYAGMQIPVGVLLDRFGPRRLITIATLLCAGGCVLFATGETLATVTAGRFLIGASSAFSLVGAMAVAGQWFGADRFALLSGMAMATGMAGGVLGQAPLRIAVDASDWRTTMLLLAGGGVALSVAAWAFIRDRWRGSGGFGAVLSGLGVVARQRQTWMIALPGLATATPLLGFAGLWGVPFLETAHGLPRTLAATLTSLMIAGFGVGAPFFGWLSDRIGLRKPPVLAGLVLQTATLVALIYTPVLPVLAIGALCFMTGLFGSSQIACFALAKESHPAGVSGTAIGFVNSMVTAAGALFQPLVGLLLDMAWAGQIAHGARVYDAGAYRLALTSLVVCCVSGCFCLLAVRETYCRPLEAADREA
jgi:MFS family permease